MTETPASYGRPGDDAPRLDYYRNGALRSLQDLWDIFKADWTPNEDNLLFCSTSGVHGSSASLDEAEACLRDTCDDAEHHEEAAEDPDHWHLKPTITVTVWLPRVVQLRYGTFPVTLEDIARLRDLTSRSLMALADLQAGNVSEDVRLWTEFGPVLPPRETAPEA